MVLKFLDSLTESFEVDSLFKKKKPGIKESTP